MSKARTFDSHLGPVTRPRTGEEIVCDDLDAIATRKEHSFALEVDAVLTEIGDMLKEKNRKYGNSALNPVRIFSKASDLEQLNVRIDDKLSRLRSGQPDETEAVVDDLLGYLVLLRIKTRRMQFGD